jgi:hypothetical protein
MGFGSNSEKKKEDNDIYKRNRKIISIAKNIGSKHELHSLILMLFMFTADNYVKPGGSEQDSTDGPLFYKSELLEFMYKLSIIVSKYNDYFNKIFIPITPLQVNKKPNYPLDNEKKGFIKTLCEEGNNIIKLIKEKPVDKSDIDFDLNIENSEGVEREEEVKVEEVKVEEGQEGQEGQPVDMGQKVEVTEQPADLKRWIFKEIKKEIQALRGANFKCIQIDTKIGQSDHPYYPNPSYDWIYGDVDVMIRYNIVLTKMLQILWKEYEKAPNDENEIITLGKNYIGNLKLDEKKAAAYRGVKNIFTFGKAALTTTGNTNMDVTPVTNTKSTTGGRLRHLNKQLPRTVSNRRRYKNRKMIFTKKIKGGGFLTNLKTAATKAATAVNSQTGITKVFNRAAALTISTNVKNSFNDAQKSKYGLLLYIEKMFDLYMVNGFDEGTELSGSTIVLPPEVDKLVNEMKETELKSISNEMEALSLLRYYYRWNTDATFQLEHGMGEVVTQGNKVANFMHRLANGQLQLLENSRLATSKMLVSMRKLAGFANRNGLIGYSILFLHGASNLLFFASPAFPPALLFSWGLAMTRNALILLASPVLAMPPEIIKNKQQIMEMANKMMQRDSNLKLRGDNFVEKMLGYFDDVCEIKINLKDNDKVHFDFPVVSVVKTQGTDTDNKKEITDDKMLLVSKKAYEIIYNDAEGKPEQILLEKLSTDTVKRNYIAKYFVDLYCQETNTTFMDMVNGLGTVTDVGFKDWIRTMRIRNRSRVINEINKYVLLLKKYMLQPQKQQYQQNNTEVNNLLIKYYDAKYKASKVPKEMIIGSKENLSANFKTMFPTAYNRINELIPKDRFYSERARDGACFTYTRKYLLSKPDVKYKCTYQDERDKMLKEQLTHILRKRNASIEDEKIEDIKKNMLKTTGPMTCATLSGKHVTLSSQTADLCNLRVQTVKPVNKYVDAYLIYLSNFNYYNPENNTVFNSLQDNNEVELNLSIYLKTAINEYKKRYIDWLIGKKEYWHKKMEAVRQGYGSFKDATGFAYLGQNKEKIVQNLGTNNPAENTQNVIQVGEYNREEIRKEREQEFNTKITNITDNYNKIIEIINNAIDNTNYKKPTSSSSSSSS